MVSLDLALIDFASGHHSRWTESMLLRGTNLYELLPIDNRILPPEVVGPRPRRGNAARHADERCAPRGARGRDSTGPGLCSFLVVGGPGWSAGSIGLRADDRGELVSPGPSGGEAQLQAPSGGEQAQVVGFPQTFGVVEGEVPQSARASVRSQAPASGLKQITNHSDSLLRILLTCRLPETS